MILRKWRRIAPIYLLFFLSGATALIYQIVWVRHLTLAFGASTYAIGAVFVAFMGGMSLGALAAARFIDRRRDNLRVYAILEGVIALSALVLPTAIQGLSQLYVDLYQNFHPGFYQISLLRLVASVCLLAVPTIAMGATLPTLCAYVAPEADSAARKTAWLYGINTLGAVAGCLAAGFVLLPYLGLSGASNVAVVSNLAIVVIALALHRARSGESTSGSFRLPENVRRHRPIESQHETEVSAAMEVSAAILAIMLSGMAAMAYESIWTRVLTMIVGTTVYAFTTMLAAVLMGLAIGNGLFLLLRPRRPAIMFAGAQILIGLWVLLAMPYFDQIPFVFLKLFAWTQHNWGLFQFSRFLLLLIVLLVPTTLMGLSFPLAVQTVGSRTTKTGKTIGVLYGFNTIGSIVGSFAGAFILIPFVGLQQGMVLGAAANIFAGLLLLACAKSIRPAWKWAGGVGVAAAALASLAVLTPWRLSYINSGAFAYANLYSKVDDVRTALQDYSPVFYREGPTATVAVMRSPLNTLMLTIDGKTDASTGQHADMSTQILLPHLPAFFVENPDNALLIGLGSGVSLGSLLREPVQHVDVLEISEAVVEASHCFREYNFDALQDARVHVVVDDGRHHLLRTRKQYDLIISQPSNPWITGVANLFTQEYYRLLAERLTDNGVACQWVPSYLMSKEMVATIVKTFSAEFPHMSIWTSGVVGDLFLIGSRSELILDYSVARMRLATQGIADDLARINMGGLPTLVKTFKFGPIGVREFLAEFPTDLPLNTDSRPIVEFAAPRYLLEPRVARDFNERSDLTGDLSRLLQMIRFHDDAERDSFIHVAGTVASQAVADALNAEPSS